MKKIRNWGILQNQIHDSFNQNNSRDNWPKMKQITGKKGEKTDLSVENRKKFSNKLQCNPLKVNTLKVNNRLK